jgi:hypothetical protein
MKLSLRKVKKIDDLIYNHALKEIKNKLEISEHMAHGLLIEIGHKWYFGEWREDSIEETIEVKD